MSQCSLRETRRGHQCPTDKHCEGLQTPIPRREHVTNSGEGALVEVSSNEINMVLQRGVEATQERTPFVDGIEQNVAVEESATEGRHSKPRTTRAAMPHVSLFMEDPMMGKKAAPGANVSLLCMMRRLLPSVLVRNWSETCGA